MKRVFAILLLVTYVISVTECKQLLKLPNLVEHFTEHKILNNKISFSDFMNMHYFGDDIKDNDEDRDMQLPFKSHNDLGLLVLNFSDCKTYNYSFISFNTSEDVTIPSSKVHLHSAYLASIWQPPKFS